jgi:hypothetical protein
LKKEKEVQRGRRSLEVNCFCCLVFCTNLVSSLLYFHLKDARTDTHTFLSCIVRSERNGGRILKGLLHFKAKIEKCNLSLTCFSLDNCSLNWQFLWKFSFGSLVGYKLKLLQDIFLFPNWYFVWLNSFWVELLFPNILLNHDSV